MNDSPDKPSASERPGYALPQQSYTVPPERHTSHIRLFVILGVSLAVVIAAVVVASILLIKPPPEPRCPQDCHAPPVGPPVGNPPEVGGGPPVPTAVPNAPARPAFSKEEPAARQIPDVPGITGMTIMAAPVSSFPRFRMSDGSFSVSYPKGANVQSNGLSWTAEGGQARFFGVRAQGLTPREIAERLVKADFP
ncbi:MAG TPA: hypothetical protein VFB19_20085, partial [Mycobacterium sp.]|nr:hypothetical protein [Mycobacterium sp.]